MSLSDLGPNWELLKHPMNWVIVAFAVLLLFFIAHFAFRDKEVTP